KTRDNLKLWPCLHPLSIALIRIGVRDCADRRAWHLHTNVHFVILVPFFFLSVDGCSKNTTSPGWLIPTPFGNTFPPPIRPASESRGALVGFFIVGLARIAARVVHASLVPIFVCPLSGFPAR